MRIALIVILSLAMVGCNGTRPLPVKEPENANFSLPGGLDPAEDDAQAVAYSRVYADYYLSESLKIRESNYQASDVTFFGSIIGVIGGLTKSPEVAIAGGALAAGSGLASQRYQYVVQAENYETAADAMRCIHRVTYPHYASANGKDDIVRQANKSMDNIRRSLRMSQAKVILATPDRPALEETFSQLADLRKKSEEAERKLLENEFKLQSNEDEKNKGVNNLQTLLTQRQSLLAQQNSLKTEIEQARRQEIIKEIEACANTI